MQEPDMNPSPPYIQLTITARGPYVERARIMDFVDIIITYSIIIHIEEDTT